MNSFLRRIKLNRLAPTFVVLSTLSAGIIIGSVAVHGVKGSENQVNSSDATPLKIPTPVQLGTEFSQIAKDVGPAVVNIYTEQLPKERRTTRRRAPAGLDLIRLCFEAPLSELVETENKSMSTQLPPDRLENALPDKKPLFERVRPYSPPGGQPSEELPPDYEPVILPGESLAKYKDRIPHAGTSSSPGASISSAQPAEMPPPIETREYPAAESVRETASDSAEHEEPKSAGPSSQANCMPRCIRSRTCRAMRTRRGW